MVDIYGKVCWHLSMLFTATKYDGWFVYCLVMQVVHKCPLFMVDIYGKVCWHLSMLFTATKYDGWFVYCLVM